MSAARHHRGAFAAAAGVVIGLDQLTKQLALSNLADGPIHLVGSLRLALTFNDSAAFSMGGGRTSWIAVLASAVAAAIAWMGLRAETGWAAVGYGVLFGGAVGNVLDRIFRAGDGFLGGRVVDFVDLQWWPVFNVADTALWVGIAILVLAAWRAPQEAATVADRS
jgi:signal peptidase II